MKKKILAAVLVAAALVSVTFTVSYTTDDPLITESYLNNVFFEKVKEYIASNINTGGATVQADGFKLVSVTKGQKFVASAGCEFIIRQGSAQVVVSSLGGVSDVTDGLDIVSGELPSNHHFVVARDDGRGFEALNNVLVLVKGGYSIK